MKQQPHWSRDIELDAMATMAEQWSEQFRERQQIWPRSRQTSARKPEHGERGVTSKPAIAAAP
ncbi:MAG TPA: hypothetical protein VN579_03805 [Bryobacteraceae bacterium]|nr:hypothetical protein [Bryobacteraceae bacterium]